MAGMSASALAAPRVLEPLNPATLKPIGAVAVTDPAGVAEAVAEARLAQRAWGERSLEERSQLLRAVAASLLESADEVAASIVAETGKPTVEALTTLNCASWPSMACCETQSSCAVRETAG